MNLISVKLDEPGWADYCLPDGSALSEAVSRLAEAHADPHRALLAHRGEWPLGWLDLPARSDYAAQCLELAAKLQKVFETLVVCGIGGSALGTQAVYAALDRPSAPLRPLVVFDNADPLLAARLLALVDLRHAAVNVISKSGKTLETMAGLFFLLEKMKQFGLDDIQIASRIVATTDAASGILRPYAAAKGWETLPVPGDTGGRYSVLSPVGLLPLAYAGVDIQALLDGARECQEELAGLPPRANPAWQLAASLYLLHTQGGISIAVKYIYGDALVMLGDWWRQLWAESLAKTACLDGSASGICLTPVVARGATDQHSQNQLYFDGPPDKAYIMLTAAKWDEDGAVAVPADSQLGELSYFNGRTFGQILAASYEGTREALKDCGRPVLEVALPRAGAREVGAYLQFWMLATAYAGLLYNINPFDQPGVERSKVTTHQRLSSAK